MLLLLCFFGSQSVEQGLAVSPLAAGVSALALASKLGMEGKLGRLVPSSALNSSATLTGIGVGWTESWINVPLLLCFAIAAADQLHTRTGHREPVVLSSFCGVVLGTLAQLCVISSSATLCIHTISPIFGHLVLVIVVVHVWSCFRNQQRGARFMFKVICGVQCLVLLVYSITALNMPVPTHLLYPIISIPMLWIGLTEQALS